MAELLGVVASSIAIIQITVEIGTAIGKFKGICDEISEVPESLQSLMRELELLDIFVNQTKDEINKPIATDQIPVQQTFFQTCLQYYHDTFQVLSDILEILIKEVNSVKSLRRAIGKVRVVLKKDAISRHEARLQRAISLLSLARQEYSR